MDKLDHMTTLLALRDSLVDSMDYASPEQVRLRDTEVKRLMRCVVWLLDSVSWVETDLDAQG